MPWLGPSRKGAFDNFARRLNHKFQNLRHDLEKVPHETSYKRYNLDLSSNSERA